MDESNVYHAVLAGRSLDQPLADADYLRNICISPLSYQSIFKVYGPDSEAFLQGQLSCDLKEVKLQGSRLGAHCNPKGGMLSLMRIASYRDDFLIKVNSDNFDDTISQLKKYMIFSKAEIEPLTHCWVAFGIYGSGATEFIELQLQGSDAEAEQVVVKVAENHFELWQSIEVAKSWIERVFSASQATTTNTPKPMLIASEYWRQREICQVIPDIYPQTSAKYIPQMCNLQALHGVSFRKGCYTGQEVITRLHFRGKLNKYLISARADTDNQEHSIFIDAHIHCAERNDIAKVLQHVTINGVTYLQLVINAKYAQQPLFINADLPLIALPQAYSIDPALFVRKN